MSTISILDSAMGSELISQGQKLPPYIWSANANTKSPDIVYKIHLENIKAGAHMITTNTFRTTPRAYAKTGCSFFAAEKLAHKSFISAIKSARKAACKNTLILGSIAPLEDCYMPALFPGENIAHSEFSQLGSWMKDAAVDVIILETMNSIVETRAALSAISSLGIPIYVSFCLRDSTHLFSGEPLIFALELLEKFSISVVLLNCFTVSIMSNAMHSLVDNWGGVWGIYPNLGVGKPSNDGIIKKFTSNNNFLALMNKALNSGAKILGGCCGTSPRHITLIENKFLNS